MRSTGLFRNVITDTGPAHADRSGARAWQGEAVTALCGNGQEEWASLIVAGDADQQAGRPVGKGDVARGRTIRSHPYAGPDCRTLEDLVHSRHQTVPVQRGWEIGRAHV